LVGASTLLVQDIPPYVTVAGEPVAPHGINAEGLKRRGFPPEAIAGLKRAYRTLYRSRLSIDEAKAELEKQAAETPEVRAMIDFIATSTRGLLR
jgi:UDP-N-acetylglucosamine acyltransferase